MRDELDLERFRELQEGGRPAEALALWRGPPLSDFAHSRFAQAEIARLEDLHLACLEERIEQDLHAGRYAELTGELEALVAEHPLRERLRGQLMLALYRSGRQAEALDAYQAARRALVDELGIEPGRELRELHQRILNQDPALDLSPEVEQNLASLSPPRLRRMRGCFRRPSPVKREKQSPPSSRESGSSPFRVGRSTRKRCGTSPAAYSPRSRPPSTVTAAPSRRSQATQLLPSLGCRSCMRMTPSGASAPPSRSETASLI